MSESSLSSPPLGLGSTPIAVESHAESLPALNNVSHVAFSRRCLDGLPASLVEVDASRMAIAFYCLSTLDLTGRIEHKMSATDRENWQEWIWAQYVEGGFCSGLSLAGQRFIDGPHLIMTYCALLALAVLRDDYAALDRPALARMVGACQVADGGFATIPGADDADLRMTYCAFVICALLDDRSCIDLTRAISYIHRCRTYEGGYGQTPYGEAIGGPTYCALAALYLVPTTHAHTQHLQPAEWRATVRWLLQTQASPQLGGGFAGRTNKLPDACYGFWCSASLSILGAGELLDAHALGSFLAQCQFKFGGIGKAPGEHPDPYHTYLAIAAAAVVKPDPKWELRPLDPLINATHDTARWAKIHVRGSTTAKS